MSPFFSVCLYDPYSAKRGGNIYIHNSFYLCIVIVIFTV